MTTDETLTAIYYANKAACDSMATGSLDFNIYNDYTTLCKANLHLGTKVIVRNAKERFYNNCADFSVMQGAILLRKYKKAVK